MLKHICQTLNNFIPNNMQDVIIPLQFSQQEMITFLQGLAHTTNHDYDIDFEIRTFYRDDIFDQLTDPIYEKEVVIVKYKECELTCPEESNFQRKQNILVEEFTKRFKTHLLKTY